MMFKTKAVRLIRAAFLSFIVLALLLSGCNYLISPTSPHWQWNSVNPFSLIEGLLFALAWVGLPVWIAVVVLVLLLGLLWWGLFWCVSRWSI